MTDLDQRPLSPTSRRLHGARAALLLATTALTSPFLISPVSAQTVPTGSSVAAGSVAIVQPSATQLNIIQSSQSAVVNWQSFSIGQGSAVNIAQPNSSSAILNRVTGSTSSTIAGQLTANGQVYLVNPNGIAITKSGTVNTAGGFVASTLGISDADFQSGKRTFSGNGASAGVTNAGTINVGRGGYAALIGGTVSNSGNINVPLGKVGLGSGEQATLDFAGDGFLQVAVPTNSGGNHALIKNSGSITADGGSVTISAATAREAARNAINISGLVQARSIGGRSGAIIIGGGGGGVKITGRLIVTSRHHNGGSIQVTGQHIKLKGAIVDASGKTGGGTINIGGGRQGAGPLQHADTTSIDKNTTIKANATSSGNGGKIVVWSDQLTTFAGNISARGGTLNGNGGEAEVSGKAKLAYTGITDLGAPNGSTGTLLLDPYNVIISSGAGTGGFTAGANDSVINATTLQTALGSANVTVSTGGGGSQAGDITVAAPVTWSSPNTLTLDAFHSINVNAPITVTGIGGLTLATNDGGTGGALTIDSNVTFANLGSTLKIGYSGCSCFAQTYTLVGDLTTLAADIAANPGQGGKFALANSINAAGTTYSAAPISNFSGTLEGLGNTISNLIIQDTTSSHVGLFGSFEFGRIENLSLANANVTGNAAGAAVGSLVGYMFSSGTTLFNDHATGGSVSSHASAGGIVGYAIAGQITNSDASMAVSSSSTAQGDYVGGLVGQNFGAIITGSHAAGAVTAATAAGGLVGNNVAGSITYSYATGAVTAPTAGGLIAQNNAPISYDYATGNVTGASLAGGLIAVNNVPSSSAGVAHVYATGTVTTGTTTPAGTTGSASKPGVAGGLIGQNFNSPVTGSYATGTVIGLSNTAASNNTNAQSTTAADYTSVLGGLIGSNQQAAVSNSYATGKVQGATGTVTYTFHYNNNGTPTDVANTVPAYVSGGLIGYNNGNASGDAPVTQSYASGAVKGSTAGGLIGSNLGATVSYDYALGAVTGGSYTTTAITGILDLPVAGPVGAAGGLIGYNAGVNGNGFGPLPAAVSQVYAIGAVSGGSANGGLIGYHQSAGTNAAATLSQAYWDAGTGQPSAVGTNNGTVAATVFLVGGSGPDPFSQSSYQQAGANFDFGTQWYSIDGLTRPLLQSEASAVIVNAHQLELVTLNRAGTYSLGANINMAPELSSGMWRTSSNFYSGGNASFVGAYGFVTVGDNSNHYSGIFDGQGHTIANLIINAPAAQYQGLFGQIDMAASVSNVILANATVSGLDHVGGLAGQSDGTISNSSTSGVVSAAGQFAALGGLVGTASPTSIIANSSSSATANGVTGKFASVGGLVGFNQGRITASHATGNPSFGGADGGLVGINDGAGLIINSYAQGTVSSSDTSAAGGLVGNNYGGITGSYAIGNVTAGDFSSAGGLVGVNFPNASVFNSYASGTVSISTTNGGNVGGLVGSNYGSVSTSYATGATTDIGNAGPWAGGLVGNQGGGSIDRSYATGSVTVSGTGGSAGLASGNQPVGGGLVGYNDGTSTITKSYSSSAVSVTGPNAEGGGLVGYNNGTISDAYARGSVTGSNGSILGGFVGYNDSTGSITRTYAANVVTAATGPLPNSSGGFVGTNISGASITKSFWDTSLTSGGFGTNTGTFSAVGLATSLMQDSLSSNGFYALASAPAQGWDFHTVWSVPNFDPAQSSDGQRHYAELYALSRVVSAIANDATKTYGDPNPALSATTYGLQNSDVLATPVTVHATTITPASNVGTYAGAISVSGGSAIDQASNNYRFVYLPGTFTITPRPITITGGTVDRFYGAPNPPTTDQFTTALTTGSGSGWNCPVLC